MRVDLESGMGFGPGEDSEENGRALIAQPEIPETSSGPRVASEGPRLDAPDVGDYIRQALSGTMVVARPLESYEPVKLSPLHIQMIMDRAMGMKPKEIAEKYDLTPVRVSVILNHPYAEVIIGAQLSRVADRATDPLARLRAYAHEMINVKVELVRDKMTPRTLRNSIASDILDRAGLGARNKPDAVAVTESQPVESSVVQRLAGALEESARARAQHDYRKFLSGSSEGGVEGQVASPSQETSRPADGPSRAGASPSGPLLVGQQEAENAA